MVLLMDDSKVGDIAGITAMGAEGSQFIGMAPFVEREHFIQTSATAPSSTPANSRSRHRSRRG